MSSPDSRPAGGMDSGDAVDRHLSISQLRTFTTCPLRHYYRYQRGLIVPPTGAQARGTAVHKGIEANYAQKLTSGVDLPVSDVEDAAAAAFDAAAGECAFADVPRGKALDDAVSLVALHTRSIAPTVQPVAVESRIAWTVPGVELPFVGIVDVVDTTGRIRDNKAVSATPTEDSAATSMQLTGYAHEAYQRTGDIPSVSLDCLVATKQPKAVVLEASRTLADLRRFERTAAAIAAAIAAEAYYPNTEGWWCTPKWCGYYDVCHDERSAE